LLALLVILSKPAGIRATGVAPRSWSPLHSLLAPWDREFRLGRFTNGLLANSPYRIHAFLTGAVGFVGVGALHYCGWEPSRAHPAVFMIGVMAITMAFLVGIGVFYGWRGFEARFGKGRLLAYWEIGDREWEEHSGKMRQRILGMRKFMLVGPVASALMIGLGYSDGDAMGVLPFALLFGALFSAVIGGVIVLQLFSLSGKGARVWLSKNGVMVNRNVFFNHSYGMRTLAWETKPEHGRHLLIIRYEVRSGRAVGEHEMLIPVPAGYLSRAEDTVRAWVSPA